MKNKLNEVLKLNKELMRVYSSRAKSGYTTSIIEEAKKTNGIVIIPNYGADKAFADMGINTININELYNINGMPKTPVFMDNSTIYNLLIENISALTLAMGAISEIEDSKTEVTKEKKGNILNTHKSNDNNGKIELVKDVKS